MPNFSKEERHALSGEELDLVTEARQPRLGMLQNSGLSRLIDRLRAAREKARARGNQQANVAQGEDPQPEAASAVEDAGKDSREKYLNAALRRATAERRQRKNTADKPQAPKATQGDKPAAKPKAAGKPNSGEAAKPGPIRLGDGPLVVFAEIPSSPDEDTQPGTPAEAAQAKPADPAPDNGVAAKAATVSQVPPNPVDPATARVQQLSQKAAERAEKAEKALLRAEKAAQRAEKKGGKKLRKEAEKAEEKALKARRKARKVARQARKAEAELH